MLLSGQLTLQSGQWFYTIEEAGVGELMELVDMCGTPDNKLRVRLPFTWRRMTQEELAELARHPDLRLWRDEQARLWRIVEVGPGTQHLFPLHTRHLIFDCDGASAGMVEFPDPFELGDLSAAELCSFRDRAIFGLPRAHVQTNSA